jgi:hypothetical protein
VEDIFSVEVLRAQGTLFFHQEKSFQDHCRDNAPSCGRVRVPGESMTFEYLQDPAQGPGWRGPLPGAPAAFFLSRGGSVRVFVEHPDGQKTARLLEPGDFGYVPAGLAHAYRVEAPTRMLSVLSGGFERFFQRMGTPADTADAGQPPFIPDLSQILAAGQRHGTRFFPDFSWPETPEG